MEIGSQSLLRAPSGTFAAVVAPRAAGTLEPVFAGLARLAARLSQSPLASIVILGSGEVWCSTSSELGADAMPGDDPFFRMAADAVGIFEVPDTAADERFRGAAHAVGTRVIKSYAGCALRTAAGDTLGVLAVYNTLAGALTPEQCASLLLLAEQGVAQAQLHARVAEMSLLTGAGMAQQPAAETPTQADTALAQALIDSAPVAVYHTDAAGKMTYVNPEYRRIFGLTAAQSANEWAHYAHPDDLANMEAACADFCRQPRPIRFDNYRTLLSDGTVRHYSEQIVAMKGAAGFIGTINDFTDLVTARGSLRKAEALYRNTFDQAPIGIAYADRGGRFRTFNQAFCSMLGFDASELANTGIGAVTHPDDLARTSAEIERLWRGEIEFVDLEQRYTRKDGSATWVRTTTALLHQDNAAETECLVQFLRNINARKESAEELERVNRQLMAASRQAGMAEVATNVLHNVGNILNSVNVSASLVSERVKQSKAPGISRLANLLREQGPRIADFIANDERGKRIPEYLAGLGEQLLNDQKIALQELATLRENLEHIKDTVAMQQSYAKLCGVTETVEVVDLVEDSLRLNAGAFVRHGVTLKREFNKVPPITVDKHKVLQILVNLVRNAKYACDESGRSDKLITLSIDAAGANAVNISVMDNGVGILAENMGRLFSHGFTTRQSGHGFGLHSGALAAQELGGSLRAKSDGAGQGATFILELPCAPAELKGA